MCFACDPNYAKYFKSTNRSDLVLSVAMGTCTGLYGACAGVVTGISGVILSAFPLIRYEVQTYHPTEAPMVNAILDNITATFAQGPCGPKDCQTEFCNMLHGFNISTPQLPNITSVASQLLGNKMSILSQEPHKAAMSLLETFNSPSVTMAYTTSGTAYDAYSVGCTSGSVSSLTCPDTSPASSGLSSGAVAGIVIVVLFAAVGIGAAVFVYQRRKRQAQLTETTASYQPVA